MEVATNVLWLPAHPCEGSYSMFTYWRELQRACRPDDPAVITCPLDAALWDRQTAPRWRRAWTRYVAYPRLVRNLPPSRVAHVLDHSSAHLLDALPPSTRSVVTVHDLIPIVDPGGLTASQVNRWRRVVQRLEAADVLVAVSHYTKSELLRLLNVDDKKIEVVPNGVCHAEQSAPEWTGRAQIEAMRRRGAELVIGSVGSTLPRKNLGALAEAVAMLTAKGRTVAVARVGAALGAELRDQFARALPEGRFHEFGRLDSGELAEFYRMVDATAVPSLHEGFGLPVLEAMQFGRPVVCSNAASLPEVGGDAALYFRPNRPEELAAQLERLCDPAVRAALEPACLAQTARFSWRNHLERLYEIYAALAASGLPSSTRQPQYPTTSAAV